jgi:hypothetical protein
MAAAAAAAAAAAGGALGGKQLTATWQNGAASAGPVKRRPTWRPLVSTGIEAHRARRFVAPPRSASARGA